MGSPRSERTLIKDRFDRCSNALNENVRRFEEIMGLYAEGEENNPGGYTKHMAGVAELITGHNAMIEFLTEYKKIMLV